MKRLTDGGSIAAIFALAFALAGCTAAQQSRIGDVAATTVESVGKKCALAPALACPWGQGWTEFRDCVRMQALPCLGVELVGLLPTAIDLMSSYRVQLAVMPARDARLAQADACIMALPEPTIYTCGDQALDACGAARIAWCVDSAAGAP